MVNEVVAHVGEMTVVMDQPTDNVLKDGLQFEPFDMLQELFRPDIVFLMRHGPTDWSKLDIKDVNPTDCANQRVMIEKGKADMRTLGVLLVANGLRPSEIVASQWCRNQQTKDELLAGMANADPDYVKSVVVKTDPALNLLLSLQGAPNVTAMRKLISSWTGEGKSGPLLLISHFTNIQELTEFSAYEGEILIIDPKRDNRVIGYLRLRSSGPDVGHFRQAQK